MRRSRMASASVGYPDRSGQRSPSLSTALCAEGWANLALRARRIQGDDRRLRKLSPASSMR